MSTQYCGDIGFLLGLHCDIDWLRFEIEVTSLCDIFFQHHNDVVAITQRNGKLQVMVIPIFKVVLISDKGENAINKGKQVVLFHLSKYSDKLYLDLLSLDVLLTTYFCFTWTSVLVFNFSPIYEHAIWRNLQVWEKLQMTSSCIC